MPNVIEKVETVRDRAVEVGLYLPLGAYSKVKDQLADLDGRRIKRFYGNLVDRGQNRAEPIERVIRRRSKQFERKAEDVATDIQSSARSTARKAKGAADDATRTAAKTTRKVAARVEAGADSVAPKLPRVAAPKKASELPIKKYNSLTANEILAEAKGLTQTELAKVYKFEQANDARSTVLEGFESKFVGLAIPTYDALTVDEINSRLDGLGQSELKTIRRYEKDTKARATVLEKLDSLIK
jgi:hypothetical protein